MIVQNLPSGLANLDLRQIKRLYTASFLTKIPPPINKEME